MELHKINRMIDKREIYILPAIIIRLNDPFYYEKNTSLEFHWLIFHARLLWLDRKE